MHEAFWNGLFDVRWEEAPLGAEAIRLTVRLRERGYAERTCRDYGHAVVHLGRFLHEERGSDQVRDDEVFPERDSTRARHVPLVRHAGIGDPGDEHGEHEVAAAIADGPDHGVEADFSRRAESERDMAMGQRAGNGERVTVPGDDCAALQHATQAFDVRRRPVGKIAQSALPHLAVLTVALAQQDGGRRVPIRDSLDVHNQRSAQDGREYKCYL